MRTYQIYLIENEFASHYFGRENMFFQLFKEYVESSYPVKEVLEKQILYITKPIPGIRLHQYLQQHLMNTKGFITQGGAYYIHYGKNSSAHLTIHDRHLELVAKGNYEAETSFFEVLRKYEHSFLAIDIENERYGWLKPIKERKFI